MATDYLWKTFAWGSHRDAALLSRLGLEMSLADVLRKLEAEAGLGWQRGKRAVPDFLVKVPVLDVTKMKSWGRLDSTAVSDSWPRTVAFPTKPSLYAGQRLIVTRRAYAGEGPRARLETLPLSFRHTAYGVPLQGLPAWQAKIILAVFLSSLGRYCLFLRAGRWGVWHDEVTQEDVLATPVRFPSRANDPVAKRLVQIIDSLRRHGVAGVEQLPDDLRRGGLSELDRAVFDLFGLTDAERDLVDDSLALHQQVSSASDGRRDLRVRVETHAGLSSRPPRTSSRGSLDAYLNVFLSAWDAQLRPDGQLAWRVRSTSHPAILCVIGEVTERGATPKIAESDGGWDDVLRSLDLALARPVSHELFVHGSIRVVGDNLIIIVKRDERRLWSRSAAREDFEATLVQAINLRAS